MGHEQKRFPSHHSFGSLHLSFPRARFGVIINTLWQGGKAAVDDFDFRRRACLVSLETNSWLFPQRSCYFLQRRRFTTCPFLCPILLSPCPPSSPFVSYPPLAPSKKSSGSGTSSVQQQTRRNTMQSVSSGAPFWVDVRTRRCQSVSAFSEKEGGTRFASHRPRHTPFRSFLFYFKSFALSRSPTPFPSRFRSLLKPLLAHFCFPLSGAMMFFVY